MDNTNKSKVPEIRFPGCYNEQCEWIEFTDAWEQRKLGDLADYKKGPFGSALKKDIFVPKSDTTVKVYEQQNAINKDWHLERYFITEEYANKLSGFKVEGGDIIVSCAGTIGETYEIPMDAEPGIINQALMKIKVKESIVNKKMFNILFTNMIDDFSRVHSNGSAIKNIPPFSDLKPMKVFLPEMDEQNKISSYFNNLDNLITLSERKCKEYEDLKKCMLQKMFPRNGSKIPEIRFPGCYNEQGEWIEFTDEWEQRKLNEFAKYSSSPLTVKDIDENGNYDLYDANGSIGKTDKSPLFDDYISIIKDGAGVGRVRKLPKNTSILGTMGALIPQNSDYNFLFSILEKTDFTKLTSGGTIPHIYFKQYGENTYYIPTLAEQTKIGEYFSNLDNLITLSERKCEEYKLLKKCMLQKMFV